MSRCVELDSHKMLQVGLVAPLVCGDLVPRLGGGDLFFFFGRLLKIFFSCAQRLRCERLA